MPKRVASLKPSLKPSSRRGVQSFSAATGNCNAIHLSIPFHSSSSSASLSTSIPESTHPMDSEESSGRLSSTISSSLPSSSSPSACSFASLSLTCLEVDTPDGSFSSSYRQVPQNEVLYEYVKGLQEANKLLDVDVAERVMQELAESMTSPLAAAMVVSSGGAHLIASAVKQFKAHGLQKAILSKGKASKAGAKSFSASKTLTGEKKDVKVPAQEKIQSFCSSTTTELLHQHSSSSDSKTVKDEKMDDMQLPHVVPSCNEARRKRQRTSDELLEFDDFKGDCHCKGSSEMYASTSNVGELRADKNLPVDAYLWRSASEFPSLCSSIQWDVNDCTGSLKGESKCSKWVELVKNKTNPSKMREKSCLDVLEKEAKCEKVDNVPVVHARNSQIDTDDVLINLSKKFGEVSRTFLEAMVDEVCDSRSSSCRSAELEATIMSRLQGMVTASVQSLPLGSTTQCKVLFTKQRDVANNTKQSAKVWCASARKKNKGKSCSDIKVKKSSGPDEGNQSKSPGDQCSNSGTACDIPPSAEHQPCSKEQNISCRAFKEKQRSVIGLKSSTRIGKGVDCKMEGMPRDDLNSFKGTDDGCLQECTKAALPSVLNLAKEAGLPDVVATACHALDKLINAALQGKGAGTNGISASQLPGRRRGKVLPAELYVALTEALVEIVQVLKDQVDLLCWCLDCLGSILPPTTLNRSVHDGFASSAFDPFFSSKDLLHANGSKVRKADSGPAGRQTSSEQSDFQNGIQTAKSPASASPGCIEMSFKSVPKSVSGAHLTGDNSSNNVIGSSLCSSVSSGSATSSISALAAVAYTATVPMLAEKAIKAILSAIQPCDIEPQSTQAALHALSAHLSSTNSKYVCDDVITFIIAAMREFKYDAEMQTESCITLSALNRAISSATGHCAWSTILDNMNAHCTNVAVQRAGCSALHVLCTRAGLGVLEWGSGKRPERAGKDSDREAGVEVLVSAMLSFPDDVRIQWHGCSALWTLVDSAGTRSVVNMVNSGALRAVSGAMRVCRTNEIMQQEGCNMIGTMARLLVEGGYGFGSPGIGQASELQTMHKSVDGNGADNKNLKVIELYDDDNKNLNKTKVHGTTRQGQRFLGLSVEWWEALKVVVAAMRSFKKSKSVQSNGTFALGCILRGAMESIHMGANASSVATSDSHLHGDEGQKILLSSSRACREQLGYTQSEPAASFERGAYEDIEQLNEAVEVTMVAMPEFPKVETIQVWGCAVFQQVFIAYVHYSKCIMLLSSTGSASGGSLQGSLQGGGSRKGLKQPSFGTDGSSNSSALAILVLSQATSTMFMISGMMALSYNGPSANGDQEGLEKSSVFCDPKILTKSGMGKCTGLRPQSSQTNQALTSVRHSWCAALGAIGDVFGHLTQSTETSVAKNLPKMAGFDMRVATRDSSDFTSRESPALSGKVAQVTAKKTLENGHLENKAGTPYFKYIFPSSQDLKSKPPTPGVNALADLPTCKAMRALENNPSKYKPGKASLRSCTKLDGSEQANSKSEWSQNDEFSQQQVIDDIKAWQTATESLANIAEMVGFPMSVKNAILAIRAILYKLEDAETVIWACHALVGLYLTWENVHLFKPGLECDREEFKAKIWGEGDVGVRQLVYLVSHWTKQNRLDVVILALQALYRACVFAATVREIEEVFTPLDCGVEAVLGAMLKVLGSGGSLSQRKKVVQQACFVLTEVCGYSIPAQIGFAAAGGADIILAAMERFDDDNEVLFNGLHALGLDSRSQADFNVLWNAALYRSNLSTGGKKASKKKGSSNSFVGFSHVFKEGTLASSLTLGSTDVKAVAGEAPYDSENRGVKFSPQLERLVFDGSSQMGRFVTWLIVGPGCGGPTFCAEVLRRLNLLSPKQFEMQSHVCLVIGHMSLRNSKWCQDFLDYGGLEAVLACLEGFCFPGVKKVLSLPVCVDGVEEKLQFDSSQHGMKSAAGTAQLVPKSNHNGSNESGAASFANNHLHYAACIALTGIMRGQKAVNSSSGSFENNHLHYAACIALTGIMRDQKAVDPSSFSLVIKALVLALHHYGGLSHLDVYGARVQNLQSEVCASARLALARLGVSWVGDSQSKHLAHEAAEVGDLLSLEALGKKNIDMMALDGQGHTPLWYAEQSGHSKVIEYLKEQEQLVGKRRAREKSKSRVRRGLSKCDSRLSNVKSVAQELDDLDSFQEQSELSPVVASEDPDIRSQVLQEKNSHLTHYGTVDPSARETSKTAHAKENFILEADCSPSILGQELEVNTGAVKKERISLPLGHLTQEVAVMEAERKLTHRKKNKGGKKSLMLHRSSEQDLVVNSGIESPFTVCENAVDGSKSHVIQSCNGVPSNLPGDVEVSKARDLARQHSSDLSVLSTSEKSTGCTAACESVDMSEYANKLLREALVSGVVENLEAALQTCMAPESGADDTLVKKVRAALTKRLKRVEKSAQLERELVAAIQERSSSQLLAVIAAIENVPRFAAAFSEKITAARSILIEIQNKERSVGKQEAFKNIVSSSDVKAVPIPHVSVKDSGDVAGDPDEVKEAGEVRGSKVSEGILGLKKKSSEALVKEKGKGWPEIHKERECLMMFRREDADADRLSFEDRLVRTGCHRERGERKTLSEPLMKGQASSMRLESKTGRVLANTVSCSSGSTQSMGERPPLLPTPPAYGVAPLPIDHVARAVIQPPRHKDQPLRSLDRISITPQLFPKLQGAPFGCSYREGLQGMGDVSDGCSSLRESAPDANELGPSHISQLFPPCSSPQLFSANTDPLCYNSWSSGYSEQGASVFNPGPSPTSMESTHLAGDFVPSSSTLFSSVYGERDEFSSGSGYMGAHFSVPLPSHRLHSSVYLQPSECNSSPLPAFVQQALSCTCEEDEEQAKPANRVSWMHTSALCFSGESEDGKQHQPIGGGSGSEPILKEKGRQPSSVNQDFQHLSQVHLQQSGMLDTSLGVPCCVCFDIPKDATLISCGHQMCKGCAEQMHRLHHPCPVCNRMIETVLSLCS